jgi:hypothetical protein
MRPGLTRSILQVFDALWRRINIRVIFAVDTNALMTLDEFNASLSEHLPPSRLNPFLQSLWYDRKGDWEKAHNIAQEIHTTSGSWIHAYLHRREGDTSNAAYWYHMADKSFPTVGLDEEWEQLVEQFLVREHAVKHS